MGVRSTKNVTITLDEDELKLLDELSKIRKLSRTEVIKEALRVYRFFLLHKPILEMTRSESHEGKHYVPRW